MFGGALLANLTKVAYERLIPLTVNVELTHNCNLRCVHCYIDFDSKILSAGHWKKILDELVELEALVLTISGGEPTLHPEFDEIYSYAHQQGFGIRLFSNLQKYDEQKMDLFERLKPLNVQTSIYGGTAELHDSITKVQGSFKRTVRASKRLIDAGIPVMIKTSWMRNNLEHYSKIEDLARSIGADFQGSVRIMVARNGDESNTSLRLTREQLVELYLMSDRSNTSWSRPQLDESENEKQSKQKKGLIDYPCGAAVVTMRIGPNGNVYPCVQYDRSAGNAVEQSIKTIWKESPWFEYLRTLRQSSAAECAECNLREDCFRCPADAYQETGNPLGCSTEAKSLADAYCISREQRAERAEHE